MPLKTKEDFRAHYLLLRQQLSQEEWEKRNTQIIERVFQFLDFQGIKVIHSFYPLAKFKEVNSLMMLERIWEKYPEIITACPVMMKDGKMEQRAFSKTDSMTKGRFGVLEPLEGKVIPEKETDLAFIPMAIADKQGNRIGYGKGFYDRFLTSCGNCTKIGLLFHEPVDEFPFSLDPWDIPMDVLIYPKGIVKVK